ncbi:DUF805 domain-containing protein [Staphylococcus xylosus]|uniref:DUF805 domain-containing protein n=1 Tax=Staphylococcus xylosus TaxID=1288 RepID=UPI003CF7F842
MLYFYKLYWLNTFQLNNRTTRKGFWIPILITILLYIIVERVLSALPVSSDLLEIIISLFILVNIIPSFTITVRRFHDVGLTMFIPLIFFIPEFIFNLMTFIPDTVIKNNLSSIITNTSISFSFILLLGTFLAFFLLIFIIFVCCIKSADHVNEYN